MSTVILIHASLRLRSIKNKLENKIEGVGLKKTPMGVILDLLDQQEEKINKIQDFLESKMKDWASSTSVSNTSHHCLLFVLFWQPNAKLGIFFKYQSMTMSRKAYYTLSCRINKIGLDRLFRSINQSVIVSWRATLIYLVFAVFFYTEINMHQCV